MIAARGRELGLGARFALAGGGRARWRTALMAAGVALGVVVLLVAASVPRLMHAHDQRAAAIAPDYGSGHGSLRLLQSATIFHGRQINGIVVQPTRPDAPLPPGVASLPGPGQMVVSPALRSLLLGPGGAELRRRLRARVVGTIGDAGLVSPTDARFVRGTDLLAARGVLPDVPGFGVPVHAGATAPIVTLLVIVSFVALLLPVGAFVVVAGRFGADERDARLATIRLVGADVTATATIAAGEALVGALIGLAAGIGIFAALRPAAQTVSIAGVSVFSTDVRPVPALAALVIVLVPAAAVSATLLGMRWIAVQPLGVSRRGLTVPRRLWWRLACPVLGLLALAPLVGASDRLGSASGQVEAAVGVMLVLVGVTALLPWLVDGAIRHSPPGTVAWLLAVRRLRRDEGTSGRAVGVIALTVAGAIALQMVFAAAQHEVNGRVSATERRTQSVLVHAGPGPAAAAAVARALRSVSGVQQVRGVRREGNAIAAQVEVRPGRADAAERVRDAAAAIDPLAQVQPAAGTGGLGGSLSKIRAALTAGAFAVLLMIGASLLLATAEQVRERRGVLSVLSAFGARRSVIARSVMWQSAIPVTIGIVLAIAIGSALGTLLMRIVGLRIAYDWGAVALMAGAGALVIALVTALTLPLVARQMAPDALRVE
jgi:hypothetical protein